MNNKELNEIIKSLIQLRGENKLDFSDDSLIEQAVKIYNQEAIGESKRQYKEQYTSREYKEAPTDKQIMFLRSQKVNVNSDMTKDEATQLISEIKGRQR
jgi:hypothetical protein